MANARDAGRGMIRHPARGAGEVESLKGEVIALRKEREEVRTRVEKMLRQIDELTAEETAG